MLYPIYLIFTIIAVLIFVILLVISPVFFIPWFFFKMFKTKTALKIADGYMTFLSNLWSFMIITALFPRLKIKGIENIKTKEKKACFISNHQGALDPILIQYVIPRMIGFIAKKELLNAPFINLWMKGVYSIPLDRKNPREGIKSIMKGVEHIKNGNAQLIFPEGTRSKSSGMREFKAGSFKLATKAGANITPITIDGTYKIFGNKPFAIRPFRKIIVTCHTPIPTENLTKEEEIALPMKVWNIINQGLETPNSDFLPSKK